MVEVVVVPAVDAATKRALQTVLAGARIRGPGWPAYDDAWRRSAWREAVEQSELDAAYAPSPRRTRGATRA
jgi:hypothetical protein